MKTFLAILGDCGLFILLGLILIVVILIGGEL